MVSRQIRQLPPQAPFRVPWCNSTLCCQSITSLTCLRPCSAAGTRTTACGSPGVRSHVGTWHSSAIFQQLVLTPTYGPQKHPRPCGDFRALNSVTVPDRYPVPHLQDFTAALQGATIFTHIAIHLVAHPPLLITTTYHQIPVASERNTERTHTQSKVLVSEHAQARTPITFARMVFETLAKHGLLINAQEQVWSS